jgi:hypothetical protein
LGRYLRAVRLDELRHEDASVLYLIGSHDNQVECQPVTGDLLQVAHELHKVRRRGVEDDNGPQSTVGERIGELSVERCIIESRIGLRRGMRSLRDGRVGVVGQIALQDAVETVRVQSAQVRGIAQDLCQCLSSVSVRRQLYLDDHGAPCVNLDREQVGALATAVHLSANNRQGRSAGKRQHCRCLLDEIMQVRLADESRCRKGLPAVAGILRPHP